MDNLLAIQATNFQNGQALVAANQIAYILGNDLDASYTKYHRLVR